MKPGHNLLYKGGKRRKKGGKEGERRGEEKKERGEEKKGGGREKGEGGVKYDYDVIVESLSGKFEFFYYHHKALRNTLWNNCDVVIQLMQTVDNINYTPHINLLPPPPPHPHTVLIVASGSLL